jgi:spoIIIJ-associated protein
VAASPDTDPRALLQDLLERMVAAMGLEARVEVTEEPESTLRGTLHGDDLGLFIGRHGQTIDAVQHLAQRIVGEAEGPDAERRRIVVDAAGYRERREAALHRQADEAAAQAVRYDRAVSLDAMTASERRLVHEYLRDRDDVETYSEGDEPDRHLVVAPAARG